MEWTTHRLGGVPRLVRPDGRVLWGLASAEELTEFFTTPLRLSGEFRSRETTEKQQRDNRETTE
jgi:hypothetical protein